MPMHQRQRRSLIGIIAGVTLAAVIFAGGAAGIGADQPPRRTEVVGQGLNIFPAESLQDWVTYADQVSVVKVLAEREMPRDDGVRANSEGYVGRTVDVVVQRTLWASKRKGTSRAHGQLTFETSGWVVHDNERLPFRFHEGTRLEVGGRYVVPLVRLDDRWGEMTDSSVYPIDDHQADRAKGNRNPKLSKLVGGRTPDELAQELASTEPDLVAEQHNGLPPRERARVTAKVHSDAAEARKAD